MKKSLRYLIFNKPVYHHEITDYILKRKPEKVSISIERHIGRYYGRDSFRGVLTYSIKQDDNVKKISYNKVRYINQHKLTEDLLTRFIAEDLIEINAQITDLKDKKVKVDFNMNKFLTVIGNNISFIQPKSLDALVSKVKVES